MGSSMVTMCPARVRLAMSTRAATVVDLPEPVGPVIRTSPRGRPANVLEPLGHPELGQALDLPRHHPEHAGDRTPLLHHVDAESRLAGQRVRAVELVARLEPVALLAGEHREDRPLDAVRVQRLVALPAARISPWTRTLGGAPADRCRSEAPELEGLSSSSSSSSTPGARRRSSTAASAPNAPCASGTGAMAGAVDFRARMILLEGFCHPGIGTRGQWP